MGNEVVPGPPMESIPLSDLKWMALLMLAIMGLLVLNHYWRKWINRR